MSRVNTSARRTILPRTIAFAALFTLFATSVDATRALAMRHLRLLRSFPTPSAVLAKSPDAVRLWLSEAPELALTKIALTDATGKTIKIGTLTRDSVKGKGAVAPIPTRLREGSYTVSWRTMSRDGHVVKGDFGFRVGVAVPAR